MAPQSFAKTIVSHPLSRLICLLLLQQAAPLYALEILDDDSMAGVHAQDGLTVSVENPSGISVDSMKWVTDKGTAPIGACTGGVSNQHACTQLAATLSGTDGNPLKVNAMLDAFGGTAPGLALQLNWQPQLLSLKNLTINTPTVDYSNRSLGNIGLYSQGHLNLVTQGGLLNSTGNHSLLDFGMTGDLIYRQGAVGSPELSFGNLDFSTRFTNGAAGGHTSAYGKVGVTSEGLVISSPYTRTVFEFDIMYKASPTGAFDRSGRQPILHFGWVGGLINPEVRISGGGAAYGNYTVGSNTFYDHTGSNGGGARSEGLNVMASWDFDSDFAWIIGQAGGNQTQARFKNWRRMGPASGTPMLSMPVSFDVLQNGTGSAGLCFGGGFASGSPIAASCTASDGTWINGGVPVGKAAMAVMIRDGHLHAYNQQIEVVDPTSSNPNQVYDWGLIYTMGKLDSDIFLYPEGRNQGVAVTTNNTGLKADITLTIQSPDHWKKATSVNPAVRATAGSNWATNTHFMIADTNVNGTGKQYGVGIINADLLWSVRDMYFRVVDSDSGYPDIPGGLWMQSDTKAVYQFRGLFGAGNLEDLSNPTSIALMDVKLSTNRFIFALSPQTPILGDAPIGFTGLLDLDGTSYFSLGEKSSPDSAYRFYDISGRIGWKDGKVNLISGQNSADGLPSLSISNTLLFGASASFGNGGGAPVVAKVGFGNESFGRIALPAGTWHSDVTLKISNN